MSALGGQRLPLTWELSVTGAEEVKRRMEELQLQFQRGEINAQQYARGLRIASRDAAILSRNTQLTSRLFLAQHPTINALSRGMSGLSSVMGTVVSAQNALNLAMLTMQSTTSAVAEADAEVAQKQRELAAARERMASGRGSAKEVADAEDALNVALAKQKEAHDQLAQQKFSNIVTLTATIGQLTSGLVGAIPKILEMKDNFEVVGTSIKTAIGNNWDDLLGKNKMTDAFNWLEGEPGRRQSTVVGAFQKFGASIKSSFATTFSTQGLFKDTVFDESSSKSMKSRMARALGGAAALGLGTGLLATGGLDAIFKSLNNEASTLEEKLKAIGGVGLIGVGIALEFPELAKFALIATLIATAATALLVFRKELEDFMKSIDQSDNPIAKYFKDATEAIEGTEGAYGRLMAKSASTGLGLGIATVLPRAFADEGTGFPLEEVNPNASAGMTTITPEEMFRQMLGNTNLQGDEFFKQLGERAMHPFKVPNTELTGGDILKQQWEESMRMQKQFAEQAKAESEKIWHEQFGANFDPFPQRAANPIEIPVEPTIPTDAESALEGQIEAIPDPAVAVQVDTAAIDAAKAKLEELNTEATRLLGGGSLTIDKAMKMSSKSFGQQVTDVLDQIRETQQQIAELETGQTTGKIQGLQENLDIMTGGASAETLERWKKKGALSPAILAAMQELEQAKSEVMGATAESATAVLDQIQTDVTTAGNDTATYVTDTLVPNLDSGFQSIIASASKMADGVESQVGSMASAIISEVSKALKKVNELLEKRAAAGFGTPSLEDLNKKAKSTEIKLPSTPLTSLVPSTTTTVKPQTMPASTVPSLDDLNNLAKSSSKTMITAAGGMESMVTKPSLILAGENGAEYVSIIPRQKFSGELAGKSGSGGMTYAPNININVEGSVRSDKDLLTMVEAYLTKELRKRGVKGTLGIS